MAMKIGSRTRGTVGRFASDRAATTAIEYALVAALIGGVIVVGIGALGGSVGEFYEGVVAAFADQSS